MRFRAEVRLGGKTATGFGVPDELPKFLEYGVFLMKPYSYDMLLEHVTSATPKSVAKRN